MSLSSVVPGVVIILVIFVLLGKEELDITLVAGCVFGLLDLDQASQLVHFFIAKLSQVAGEQS